MYMRTCTYYILGITDFNGIFSAFEMSVLVAHELSAVLSYDLEKIIG